MLFKKHKHDKNAASSRRETRKRIAILGSTGSIGTQSLDIIRRSPESYKVVALSCAKRVMELAEQIEEFHPEIAVTADAEGADALYKVLAARGVVGTEIAYGPEALNQIATMESADTVINSLMGMRGLVPTYKAVMAGKEIAFANKETLVVGGELVMNAVKEKGAALLPIDSEHSAIFQCLQGNEGNPVNKILLTGSGGPFRGYSSEELKSVTKEQALHHPKWVMGQKITIDSATLMNKGLEVIEARWLFDVTADQIEVLIHPQSIIHSAVEFKDHSIIAQMGNPDMRIPISYALSYPKRVANDFDSLDFFALSGGLTFEKPDMETFKPLKYAFEALKAGGSAPVVLNAANEELVQSFLEDRIGFTDIIEGIERTMENHNVLFNQDLDAIIQTDLRVRRQVKAWVEEKNK